MGRTRGCGKRKKGQLNAPLMTRVRRRIRVTHPFHPLYTQEFEVVNYRKGWAKEVVDCRGEGNRLITVPLAWTDAAEVDPFVVLSAGRSYFRVEDLVLLAEMLERIRS
jgi:hypothetical protein